MSDPVSFLPNNSRSRLARVSAKPSSSGSKASKKSLAAGSAIEPSTEDYQKVLRQQRIRSNKAKQIGL